MVNGAYVTYEKPFGDLTVLGGLRVEDERLGIQQITQSVTVNRDEVGVFPTLHLGYKQNANVTWIANYSLRIQRPQPQDLNPYRNLTDPFNIRAGNALLEPEKTNSFEAGWQYRKGATSYLATAFYRQSDNSATDVVTDLGGGVLQTTRENVSSGKVAGLELVADELQMNFPAELYPVRMFALVPPPRPPAAATAAAAAAAAAEREEDEAASTPMS